MTVKISSLAPLTVRAWVANLYIYNLNNLYIHRLLYGSPVSFLRLSSSLDLR